MLSELRLENFRCFEDHTIPLRPLTIIVGRNNAGKSTIVEALRIVSIEKSDFDSHSPASQRLGLTRASNLALN